eukprot:TRINITY_DN2516_c0_g1_i3.p3 TRINITY_DN2516_c0_g1~~TRINITY_DN2516_c0_g1_i3.p3  ORF type:complete len:111 (-),score=25.55 TRINITY_DN2516_c0_g1_i3:775-1107(-)
MTLADWIVTLDGPRWIRAEGVQLVTTNLVLAVCGVVMMIFSTIILLKVTAGFAIAILSVGGFMILLSIYGCWSSKDSADCRIYLYIVLLCMALLAQVTATTLMSEPTALI